MSAAEALEGGAGGALTLIPRSAVSTIVAADESDILGKIAERVAAFKPDISTPKGRAEIKALSAEIARGKMELLRIGKGLTEGWRKSTKAVNEECHLIEDRMDELKEKVRAPLTAWENVEKDRVAGHEAALARMQALASPDGLETSEAVMGRMNGLDAAFERDWQLDFTDRAIDVHAICRATLQKHHVAAVRREAEAEELARLRAEAEDRRRQDEERARQAREADIARQAAEKARIEAEERAAEVARAAQVAAEAERERAERETRAAEERAQRAEKERQQTLDRAERERVEAHEGCLALIRADGDEVMQIWSTMPVKLLRQKRDKLLARVKEWDWQEFEDRAIAGTAEAEQQFDRAIALREEADAAEAEHRRQDAAASAEQARQDGIRAERERQAAETAKQKVEDDRRAANKAHQTRINRDVLAALLPIITMASGDCESIGKAIVTAIARGDIPHVQIKY